jgi:hypothetical protein
MRTDKVKAYWFDIYKKHESGNEIQDSDYFNLYDLVDTGTNIDSYTNFSEVLKEIKNDLKEDVFIGGDDDKTLSLLDWEDRNRNIVEGVFAKGRKGRRADHLPVDEARDPDNTPDDVRERDARDKDTAAEERYYFLIYIPPENPKRALIIMHTHGVGGVVGLFRQKLNQKLISIDSEIRFHMSSIAGEQVINRLQDESIIGFELVKKGVSAQEHLSLSNELGGDVDDAKVKVDIRATSDNEWRLSRGQLEDLAERKSFDYAEILPEDADSFSFEPDKTNIKVRRNGRPRKVDLSDDRVSVEVELLPEQLEYIDGRLSMNSVGKEAQKVANETLEQEDYGLLDTENCLLQDSRTIEQPPQDNVQIND